MNRAVRGRARTCIRRPVGLRRAACVRPIRHGRPPGKAQAVDAQRVKHAVLVVIQVDLQRLNAIDRCVEAGRAFHTPRFVSVRAMNAGDDATRDERIRLAVAPGSAWTTRGKKSAAFRAASPVNPSQATGLALAAAVSLLRSMRPASLR